MGYAIDDVDVGMMCISIIGIAGLGALVYTSKTGINYTTEIVSFVGMIAGLIAALVRGKGERQALIDSMQPTVTIDGTKERTSEKV